MFHVPNNVIHALWPCQHGIILLLKLPGRCVDLAGGVGATTYSQAVTQQVAQATHIFSRRRLLFTSF